MPESRFARSVSLLAGGAAIGQAIVVAASPILTRLYTPEDFGVLAVFASLLGILGVVASLRYQLAIPLPDDLETAANVTILSLLIVIGMAVLTAGIVIPLRYPISEILNVPILVDYIWLLPLGLLLTGTYEVLNYWAIRKKAFADIAHTKLTQSVGMVGVQVGAFSMGPVALLIGRIMGQAVGTVRLFKIVRRDMGAFNSVGPSGLFCAVKTYRSFPLVSSWSALASVGGAQLPALLIAMVIGPAAAGLFALTSRVMALPIGVISKSLGDVFYSEAVGSEARGKLGTLVVDLYSKMVHVGLPIAMVLTYAAPSLFTVIFGKDWAGAGELASWLTLGVFFQFVTTPPGRVFLILNRHGYALFFQILFLLVSCFSILVGGVWYGDLNTVVALLAIGRSIVYCLRYWKILQLVGEGVDNLIFPILKNLPYAFLCSVPVVFALHSIDSEDAYKVLLTTLLYGFSITLALLPGLNLYMQKR